MRGEMEAFFLPKYEIDNLSKKYERLGNAYDLEKNARENDFISYRDTRFLDLDERLLDLCRDKLSDFIKVEIAFRKFFDSNMLEEILEGKADTDMVINLNKVKANVSELATTN